MPKRPKKWPRTVEEAVEQLMSSMSEEDKERLRNMPEEDLILLHMGLGLEIRNTLGLGQGNKELLESCGLRSMPDSAYDDFLPMQVHPDDASGVIVEALWKALQMK